MLASVTARVFLWNVFPLHLHERANPFTNRAHRPVERAAGEEVLEELIALAASAPSPCDRQRRDEISYENRRNRYMTWRLKRNS
jgi:hypothetical protein